MNKRKYNNVLQLFIYLILLTGVFGCIKEDQSSCGGVTVTVLISPDSGEPNDESKIDDIVLYIFDANNKFIDSRETTLNKREVLMYPNAGKLTVVAWCNTLGGSVDVTPMNTNNKLSDGLVSLKRSNITVPGPGQMYQIPDDILSGSVQAVNNNQQEEHLTLYVTRVVASMNITVRGLKKFAGFNDENYSFIVGTTKTTVDFTKQYSGGGASFFPPSSFNKQGEFVAPTFRLFPSRDERLSVRIYHDTQLIDEVWSDSDDVFFETIENKTLNVLIDYSDLSNIVVTILTTKWDEVHQWEKVFD